MYSRMMFEVSVREDGELSKMVEYIEDSPHIDGCEGAMGELCQQSTPKLPPRITSKRRAHQESNDNDRMRPEYGDLGTCIGKVRWKRLEM